MRDDYAGERAVFAHLRAALEFTYRTEWSGAYPSSQIGKLHIMWKPEYTIAERHAQAAMIQTHLLKLRPEEHAFIECKYRYGPQRYARIKVLIRYLIPAMSSNTVSVRMVRELIYRYLGDGLSYERIAKIVRIDAKAVDRLNKKLVPLMSALCAKAEGRLEEDFKRSGLIP